MTRDSIKGRRWALILLALAVLTAAGSAFAYNPFQDDVNGTPQASRWPNASVTYYINPTTANNVSTISGVSIQTAIENAFTTWTSTTAPFNGQLLTDLQATDAGTSTLNAPDASDCLNVIGFSDSNTADFPTGTIAFTEVSTVSPAGASYSCGSKSETSTLPSQLIDADIEFSPKIQFTTCTPSSTCPGQNQFDLQSVATHEIGHLLGMDHSGLAEAVMFPFGDTTAAGERRSLSMDDLLGIAFLYPSSSFASSTGELYGTVDLSETGAFAAQVIAVDASTGDAVMDGLTNSDGTFNLVGVPPGTYNLLVLPLGVDDTVGLYTLSDFSGWSCGYSENAPPCCDPKSGSCTGKLSNPTNYTGKFF
jgi:hypothetical protein